MSLDPVSVTIHEGGPMLAADLYLPPRTSQPVPAVVTGSGFGGVKEMLLPHFGRALAQAGVATLAVDYAGFGGSAGEPRQDLDPAKQIRDLRRGLDWLCEDSRIDGRRLGIFGPSMCGAHTLVVAGTDSRIRAALALVPYVLPPRKPPSARMGLEIAADLVRSTLGRASKLVAAAGLPGELAVMTSDGARDWIEAISADAPTFRNEITVRSLTRLASYRPMRMLGPTGIRAPLRTILSRSDGITPAAVARVALASARHDCIELEGTHFELFGEHLPEVTRLTVDWFVRHLQAQTIATSTTGPSVVPNQ